MAVDGDQPCVSLPGGAVLPLVGLGTWVNQIRWGPTLYARGELSLIPKSATPERIAVNFDVFGFSLDDDEVHRIDALCETVAGQPGGTLRW